VKSFLQFVMIAFCSLCTCCICLGISRAQTVPTPITLDPPKSCVSTITGNTNIDNTKNSYTLNPDGTKYYIGTTSTTYNCTDLSPVVPGNNCIVCGLTVVLSGSTTSDPYSTTGWTDTGIRRTATATGACGVLGNVVTWVEKQPLPSPQSFYKLMFFSASGWSTPCSQLNLSDYGFMGDVVIGGFSKPPCFVTKFEQSKDFEGIQLRNTEHL